MVTARRAASLNRADRASSPSGVRQPSSFRAIASAPQRKEHRQQPPCPSPDEAVSIQQPSSARQARRKAAHRGLWGVLRVLLSLGGLAVGAGVPQIQLSYLTPSQGPSDGGTKVTIHGYGFRAKPDAPPPLPPMPANATSLSSADQQQQQQPPAAATAGGNATSATHDSNGTIAASPPSAPAPAHELYVHLDNIDGQYRIVEPLKVTEKQIEFVTPGGLSDKGCLVSVHIQKDFVETAEERTLFFKVFEPPVVESFQPSKAFISGGTTIHVFGRNIFPSDTIKVKFVSSSASTTVEGKFMMLPAPSAAAAATLTPPQPPKQPQQSAPEADTQADVKAPQAPAAAAAADTGSSDQSADAAPVDASGGAAPREGTGVGAGGGAMEDSTDNGSSGDEAASSSSREEVKSEEGSPDAPLVPAVVCESPVWRRKEKVEIFISMNGQQYHGCNCETPPNFTFEEETTLFGDVAKVKERPVAAAPEQDDDSEESDTKQTVKVISQEHPHLTAGGSSEGGAATDKAKADPMSVHLIDSKENQYVLSKPKNSSGYREDFRLIMDVVILIAAASLGGIVSALVRQPVVLGFLAAGMIVGPGCLNLIDQIIQVDSVGQLGACFLLFSLGLEFHPRKVRRVKKAAINGGIISLFFLLAFFAGIAVAMGTSVREGLFVGAFVSMSSTAVCVKDLSQKGILETVEGQATVGILIIQDVMLGVMLAVLPSLGETQVTFTRILMKLSEPLVMLAAYAVVASLAAVFTNPPLFILVSKMKSKELYLLGNVSFALGVAALTDILGLSLEMGSFVAGVMLTQLPSGLLHETEELVEPLKDVFGAMFFACIGLAIDPLFMWDNMPSILGVLAAIFVAKAVIITPLLLLADLTILKAWRVALTLAHIGEFAFVLAGKGWALALISRQVYLLLIGTAAMSLLLTPFILKMIPTTGCTSLDQRGIGIPMTHVGKAQYSPLSSSGQLDGLRSHPEGLSPVAIKVSPDEPSSASSASITNTAVGRQRHTAGKEGEREQLHNGVVQHGHMNGCSSSSIEMKQLDGHAHSGHGGQAGELTPNCSTRLNSIDPS